MKYFAKIMMKLNCVAFRAFLSIPNEIVWKLRSFVNPFQLNMFEVATKSVARDCIPRISVERFLHTLSKNHINYCLLYYNDNAVC